MSKEPPSIRVNGHPVCSHYENTPEEDRIRMKHIAEDLEGDCPHWFGCCEDCKNNLLSHILQDFGEFLSGQEVKILVCGINPDHPHGFPSFVQYPISELEDEARNLI